METPITLRVMADMFDGGSLFLTSFIVLNMVIRDGISKHELRFHGGQS